MNTRRAEELAARAPNPLRGRADKINLSAYSNKNHEIIIRSNRGFRDP